MEARFKEQQVMRCAPREMYSSKSLQGAVHLALCCKQSFKSVSVQQFQLVLGDGWGLQHSLDNAEEVVKGFSCILALFSNRLRGQMKIINYIHCWPLIITTQI